MFDIKNNYKRHIDIMMNSNCKGQGKYRKSKHTLISINCKLTYAHPLRNNLTYSTRVLVDFLSTVSPRTDRTTQHTRQTNRPAAHQLRKLVRIRARSRPTNMNAYNALYRKKIVSLTHLLKNQV